jgi:hypothetical protein
LVDVGGSDPGYYFATPPIAIITDAFTSINRPGTYTVHLSCRVIPGGVNVNSLAQALALQQTRAYRDVTITIDAPRQRVSVTPTSIVIGQTYPFTFTGKYPVKDGSGVAITFLCDHTGDLYVGVNQTPMPLDSHGRVQITQPLGVPGVPPGGLFACLRVTYGGGTWGFGAAPVPIAVT